MGVYLLRIMGISITPFSTSFSDDSAAFTRLCVPALAHCCSDPICNLPITKAGDNEYASMMAALAERKKKAAV